MEALVAAQDIPGVDFVGYAARVVVGVDRSVMQQIADCLEMVVVNGDDPDLHTLTGAFFPDIRSMYLIVSGAMGTFKRAHKVAFPR